MSNDVVDQMARDNANTALSKIAAHEQVCAERYGNVTSNLRDLKTGIEGLYRRFWAAALGAITLLMGACGTLIYLVLQLQH